jgi:hypothetical protein
LTDLEHRIVVEDLRFFELEVRRRVYDRPAGELCGGADTTAFFGDWWTDPAEEPEDIPFARTPPIGSPVAGPPAGASTFAAARGPATRFVAIDAAAPTSARGSAPSSPAGSCVPDGETLCLLDGRLAVRVDWADQHNGGGGVGRAVPSTDLTGYFWFFAPQNLELAVKALDGRSVNGKLWLFHGALTDVGYTITVRDTLGGPQAVRSYQKPPGSLCGQADTAGF